jgi:hypothetical protein
MSTKKLIKDLLEKLKTVEDPVEREDLEDQILRLAEQDEMIDNITKSDPVQSTDTTTSNIDSDLEPEKKLD